MSHRLVLVNTEDEGWQVSPLHMFDHPEAKVCPGCGRQASRTALVDAAYTWKPCECERAAYRHLTEQLWHLVCLAALAERGMTIAPTSPQGTRLILATEDLLSFWGTRTEDGRRITAEWGERRPEGWYEPTFTATDDGWRERIESEAAAILSNLALDRERERDAARADADRLAEALRKRVVARERPAGRGYAVEHDWDDAHPMDEPCDACDALAAHDGAAR